MRAAVWSTLIAIVAILAGAGCESSAPSRASVETPAPIPRVVRQTNGPEVLRLAAGQIPGMTTTEAREVELPGVLETTGQITFDDRRVSTIVSRVAGRIEETRVSQWDNVRRGEPIVELYSPDLMTAEAEYIQAQTTLRLSASPQVGGAMLAPALLSAARRKLELLGMSESDIAVITAPSPSVWIRAPIGGTVIENKAVRGAQVNPGDVLYTLGTLNGVWITANIYEDDIARVKLGQQMEAVTTAYPDQVFQGFVSRISPNIDPATHTLQIRCEVANPDLKLKPEMLARVKIVTRPGQALVVPQEALVFDTNQYYAFVEIAPGTFERRAVSASSWKEEGLVRVTDGLRPGDRVVVAESIQINALWHEALGESS
ncbi:MAG TPA: efflux RND transporter periplasmic adaptor subunit [Candidatus Binataceae bacterium]|nr:efflux RND transporter periplasmic adaptor subunit [Candidatus Binataceae bacterium]